MTNHKRLCVALLVAIVLLFALTSPILAYLYRAAFTIANNSSTDYTGLPVSCTAPVVWLIDNGFITTATALDTRVETFGGSDQLHMMVDDRIMAFAPTLDANSQLNWYLSTGNTPLPDFPVITGYGGNVTVTDADALELGSNFEIEFDGWLDTTVSNDDPSFPVVATSNTSKVEVAATNHTVSLPSGISAGDLLLVVFQTHQDGVVHSVTWPPTGWTSLASYGAASSRCLGVAYKIATGSEGASIYVATNVAACSAHQTFRITNYSGIPAFAGTVAESFDANPNPPNLTPSWATGYPTLWIAGYGGGTLSSRTVSSYPVGYSSGLFIEASCPGPFYAHVGSAQKVLTASSENPGTYTLSGITDWRSFTVGVKGTMPSSYDVKKEQAFYVYPGNGTYNTAIVTTTAMRVVTASVNPGEHKVKASADGANLIIAIDDVVEDTIALGGMVVTNNTNNWAISMPYFNYYKHTVSGTLIAWYQPITLISGTTLPDRQGTAQNGIITWGTNPSGVTVTLGSLTAEAVSVPTDDDDDYIDPLHDVEVTDWFKEPDIGVKLANHPLRPLVRLMSDGTTATEVQAWRFLGLAVLLLMTVSSAVLVRGHLLIAGLACGGTIALLVQQTVWPGWTLVFVIPAIIAGLLAERTPSI